MFNQSLFSQDAKTFNLVDIDIFLKIQPLKQLNMIANFAAAG